MISPSEVDNSLDVMLDIETLALSNTNSVILSIGMVEFSPTGGNICDFSSKLMVLDILPQIMAGRIIDPKTVKFWQDPERAEARRHFEGVSEHYEPDDVCEELRIWLGKRKRVWANGIMFDLGNVSHFYEQFTGMQAPWHYQAPTDMRTLCRNTVERRTVRTPDGLTAHHPISDCVMQIHRVWEHYDLKLEEL